MQEDVAEPFLKMLYGAMDELKVGDPKHFDSDVGPLIDQTAQSKIGGYVEQAKEEGRLLKQIDAPKEGHFIAPAVISGWLLAFTLSLDDLVIASFTSGPSSTTLPIKIFSAVRLGVSPEINALSTLMIAIVTVGVITASLMTKRSAARRQREERLADKA